MTGYRGRGGEGEVGKGVVEGERDGGVGSGEGEGRGGGDLASFILRSLWRRPAVFKASASVSDLTSSMAVPV